MSKTYYNVVETLVCICTVNEGKIKIYLKRKNKDPYKGYWILPGDILSNNETLEEKAKNVVLETTSLLNIKLIQSHIFSNINRDPEERIIAATYIAITLQDVVKNNNEMNETQWFDIDELPKMGYDHDEIITTNMNMLKRQIINNEEGILLKLFPRDFTLPELQNLFETVTGKELDRRNFRKKIITQNYVIDTGEKHSHGTGRPGKLYHINPDVGNKSFLE